MTHVSDEHLPYLGDCHDVPNHDSNHETLPVSHNEMLSYLTMPSTLVYYKYSGRVDILMVKEMSKVV